MQHNYHKINADAREEEEEEELEVLKNALSVNKEKMNECEDEKKALKEEKKLKLEYMLFDLLKDGSANKVKLKRIKRICDE
jgi:hypothetical protein